MNIKKILKEEWKPLLVSCIVVSVGAFIIHIKQYSPVQLSLFLKWLTLAWLFVFCSMMGFKFFLEED